MENVRLQKVLRELAELVQNGLPEFAHKDITTGIDEHIENVDALGTALRGYRAHAQRVALGNAQQKQATWLVYKGTFNATTCKETATSSAVAVGATLGLTEAQVTAIITEETRREEEAQANKRTRTSTSARVQKQYSVTVDGILQPGHARANGEVAKILAKAGIKIGTAAADAIAAGVDTRGLEVRDTLTRTVDGKRVDVYRVA